MPKATVDEHSNSEPGKDDVRHPPWFLQDGMVDAIIAIPSGRVRGGEPFRRRFLFAAPRPCDDLIRVTMAGRATSTPLSSGRGRGQVQIDTATDGASEVDWHGVADQAAQYLESDSAVFRSERIGTWETLKERRFS